MCAASLSKLCKQAKLLRKSVF